jgi:DNA-binding IclR family transcriptional regulator
VSPKSAGTLRNGLAVLSLLAESPHPMGLSEVGREMSLSKATTYRLLLVLDDLGYVTQDPETRKYRLGLHILSIARGLLNSMELRVAALPYMRELYERLGETVNLAVLEGHEIVLLERISSRFMLNSDLPPGSHLPTFCTAIGKVMLAQLPEATARDVLGAADRVKYTERTVTKIDDIMRELRTVRTRGAAFNDQEYSIGVRSAAAPVFDARGLVASVDVTVPTVRVSLRELQQGLATQVMETARLITHALGGSQPNR